ncbi:MAG: hypothetical protein GXO22_05545 [Aquificae bacterium]|nr:hypothetical protein [Aquificota bacterium]
MKAIKISDELYELIKKISKEENVSEECVVEELIRKSLDEKLLEKAKKIIKEEKNLLKRLS